MKLFFSCFINFISSPNINDIEKNNLTNFFNVGNICKVLEKVSILQSHSKLLQKITIYIVTMYIVTMQCPVNNESF